MKEAGNTLTIYGIPNCDTTKKAFSWLKQHGVNFEFHDYKTKGIGAAKLKEWIGKAGMDKIFNKNSTTWKEMAAGYTSPLTTAKAIELMQQHTSIIKRPVAERNGILIAGFKEKEYETQFLSS